MSARPSPQQAATAIAAHLYKIQAMTGAGFFKLWDDWLALAVAALSRQPGEDDERYMSVMRTYGPRITGREHPADHFAHALGEFFKACQTASALSRPFPDFLGLVYEQESVTNRFSGQFFTPEPICQMMATMMIEPTNESISIADPACGSGRFFIAAQPLAPNATFYGIDRDLTCVRMAALNMLVRNANACILHGNTLSLECFGGYVTRSTALGGVMAPLTAEDARSIVVAAKEQMATPPEPPVPTNAATMPTPAPIIDRKGQFGFDF